MNEERRLLPWILGALCVTALAVAITALSSIKTAPPMPAPRVAAQSSPVSAQPPAERAAPAVGASAAAQGSVADPTPQQSPPQVQVAAEPPAQSGQIWECTTKGVKTFSNNPCGDKSALVEVGPINTMNPTPAVHYARAYGSEPHYVPTYADSDGSADQEPYSDPASAESGGYTIVQGVGFVARRRPEHSHHRPLPNHHNPGPMPRRY